MRIIADTNLIVRVLTRDDEQQFERAAEVLDRAEIVVFPIVMLCETAWVLSRTAKWPAEFISRAFRTLLDDPRASSDRVLVDEGLALLDAGGDFADGVIAADGRRFAADAMFVTFDGHAARLLEERGVTITLLR